MAKRVRKKVAKSRQRRPRKKSISAEDALRHLELRNIRLLAVNTKIEIKSGKLPIHAQINLAGEVKPSSDGHLHVNGIVAVEGRPQDAAEDDSRLMMQIHYQCVFGVVEVGISDLAVHAKTIANTGVKLMWPYIRELVQSLTGRMGMPLVLPLVVIGLQAAESSALEP